MKYKSVRINSGSGSSYDGKVGVIVEIIDKNLYIVEFPDGVKLPFTSKEITLQ